MVYIDGYMIYDRRLGGYLGHEHTGARCGRLRFWTQIRASELSHKAVFSFVDWHDRTTLDAMLQSP